VVAFSEAAVGESLRDKREASGLTMGEAARHCSIPLTYLLKIEAGLVRTAGSRTNLEIIEEVAHGIRALRNFGEATPVIMREIEADILISLLDLTDPNLLVDIMQAFSLAARQVDDFLAASVRRFERRAEPTDGLLLDRLHANPSWRY
jgi:transcriptional regulator with XRE-family HTH domain